MPEIEEVRRESDGELEGFVRRVGDSYQALTVFHGLLARLDSATEARDVVHASGLSSLAERWYWWSRETDEWSVVLLQEVRPGTVRVAVGYYSLPESDTALITSDDLEHGDILTLEAPDAPVRGIPG